LLLNLTFGRVLLNVVMQSVMSQVFASINHNLAVEYGNIELPDQEAKNRLLADAQYLHEKLSALQNVSGASTGMLMTIVSERPTANQPSRANASQRIKGILSRQTSRAVEKGLPVTPSALDVPASPSPLPSSRPASPLLVNTSLEMNGTGAISVHPRSSSLPVLSDGESVQAVPDAIDKHENGIVSQPAPHEA
jgi:vacuolar protein sorting-associated protein 54